MITKDEAFLKYEDAIGKASQDFDKAKADARAVLKAELNTIRAELHQELKEVRAIQQKKGR